MAWRPLRVALTGGIATGKSHCLAGFASLGVPVIDADELARDVVRPGSPGLAAVTSEFGPGALLPTGDLDREGLGRLVFADPTARIALERIIHPAVYAAIGQWFHHQTRAPLAIADIPLLYETGRDQDFDRVIVAACTPAQQAERLARRGLSEADAQQRLGSQLPIDEKTRRADYVIDTSGTLAETDRQVVEVYERLKAIAGPQQP